jgi:hypothetical protein
MVLTEKGMKLSKEQKAALASQLDSPYGRVHLLCDGYEIILRVERAKGLSYRVVTYVNGSWKGTWCSGRESYPEQKFLNRKETPLTTPSKKAEAEKIFGNRAVAKDPFYSKKIVTYDLSWPSGKVAINHLCRVCESVEIVTQKDGAA